MTQSVHKRLSVVLLPLLLPIVLLVLSAVALGYGLGSATSMSIAPAAKSAHYPLLILLACLGLLAAVLMLHIAARQAFMPWLLLAQIVHARAPRDLGPVLLSGRVPQDVQTLVQALNRLLAQLDAQGEAQQRFVADAAHQLRTPLAALQSQVEAWALTAQLAENKSICLHSQQIEHLKKASRRTTQLANQLLVLSRVDSGLRQAQEFQRVDLKSLCEALLESFIEKALKKDLDLGVELESAHVSGHEWLLRELLTNVLDNAVKYTPLGGKVTLRCGKKSVNTTLSRAFIEVEDDGHGVNVCEYTRLTKRFYRVAGSPEEGTGLGLAIAEEIAIAHGSSLQFDQGENGRGLKVTVIFSE